MVVALACAASGAQAQVRQSSASLTGDITARGDQGAVAGGWEPLYQPLVPGPFGDSPQFSNSPPVPGGTQELPPVPALEDPNFDAEAFQDDVPDWAITRELKEVKENIEDEWFTYRNHHFGLSYVPGGGDWFGFTDFDFGWVYEATDLPSFTLTPRFGLHLLHGPEVVDVPPVLFDFSFEVLFLRQVTPRLGIEAALAPSFYSDLRQGQGDALRVFGRAIGYWALTENTQLVAGVMHLDREDIPGLPVIGAIFNPWPNYRIDVLYPRPRIAYLFSRRDDHDRWLSMSGELGGGTWAVRRDTGVDDVLSYRDLRLVFAVDKRFHDGTRTTLDFAFLFGRKIEYKSTIGSIPVDDNVMFRLTKVY